MDNTVPQSDLRAHIPGSLMCSVSCGRRQEAVAHDHLLSPWCVDQSV